MAWKKRKAGIRPPELVELYRAQGREMDAIKAIRDSLPALDEWYSHENIFFLYLDLLKSQNMPLDAACEKAIKHCPGAACWKR